MRLRLAHTQALLLLSAVLLTVLCMGALNAWNLRNGFSDFLASRDAERLELFADFVASRAEAAGGIDALTAQGVNLHMILREFGHAQGAAPRPHIPKLRAKPDEPGFFAPPPAPIDSIDAFKDRVALYALNGQPLLDKSLPSDTKEYVQRPVLLQGKAVAVVRMQKLKPVTDDVETRFLTSQYLSIVVVAGVLLLAALLFARWIAQHWVRPLIAIQTATERIAQGALDTRLHSTRADEIGDAMRNINRMAESLQKLDSARRMWIADMSHELRTPLTVLRGEIEAMLDGVIAITPKALTSLHEEVLQLGALVDDLHLLAMADLRTLPCYFEELDAVALVDNTVQRFALRASQQGLTLHVKHKSDKVATPILVRWDAKRITQLLGNVLDNAMRYTDAPGTVELELIRSDTHVTILVQDSAPSLTAHELTHIFEPLYRADSSRQRENGGSGLGLAICLQIARAHRGSIRAVTSSLGGVQFIIELPLHGDAAL